jgi:hypothetical protein
MNSEPKAKLFYTSKKYRGTLKQIHALHKLKQNKKKNENKLNITFVLNVCQSKKKVRLINAFTSFNHLKQYGFLYFIFQ